MPRPRCRSADYEVHVGDVALRVQVDGGELRIAQLAPGALPPAPRSPSLSAPPAGEPDLVFAAGPGIRRIISGELTPSEAIDQEVVAVVAGDATLLERFADNVRHPASGKDTDMTGRISIDLFTTLDLVAQAPGGPDEDTEGGFPYGGWQAPLFDEVVGRDGGGGHRAARRPRPRPQDLRHLRVVLAAPHRRPRRRHRAEVQQHPEVRRVARHAHARLGRHDPVGTGCRSRGRGAARPAREHPHHRQRRLRPDAAGRRGVRRARAVGLPDRARPGEEGLPGRCGAREPRAPRPARHGSERGRAAALRTGGASDRQAT